MGLWVKTEYGREKIGKTGIMFAGTSAPGLERKVLKMFDEVLYSRDHVYHNYLVKKGKKTYPLLFNILGAPAAVDALSVLHAGGCRNLIFIGYAYGGFENLEVGSIVVPTEAYHFEGIFHPMKIDKEVSFPDNELNKRLKQVLRKAGISFLEGINISVPAVTLQPKHKNKDYERIKPLTLEMEYAAVLSRAKEIGIRAAGLMIISDNKEAGLDDDEKRKIRRKKKEEITASIIKNLDQFSLKPLKHADKFDINQYLAEVIETDDEAPNVYRKT
jgi:purine-nucleoside phosphorylase